jgi:serine/threonine protein kinase
MKDNSPAPPDSQSGSDRSEAIFHGALQIPIEQRADYINQACGRDNELRLRVENLLKANDDAGTFLEEPAASPKNKTIALEIPLTEKAGDRIGRYKLLQQIGEGGCGVVYMAEQEQPVRRRVALKVIKLGMDTKQVVARFEAERQALAMMDHPNIAKVLDAGATETGRPFFVMELVRGIKITEYCDQNKLSAEERLKLFIQVCHAIQHAHQKGIIHRDIKPSNILVTVNDGVPVPKVIDFGIAKATEQRLTDKTVFTAFEQFIGTPAYMSPEQAVMTSLDIDTRTDIYSLGVLLYELLTGQTPFDAKKLLASGLDAIRKTIREEEPQRPSTRLQTMLDADLTETANRYRTEAPRLIHLLRGDLDWIVMKALEKDRTRRYETANSLAMDIERYLSNDTVIARPPSTFYRFQKLVRRNKPVFAGAAAVMAAILAGLAISTWSLIKETKARQRAVAAEQKERLLREEAEQSLEWSRKIARAGMLLMYKKYDESEQALRDVPPHASLIPFYMIFGGLHAQRSEWRAALTNWMWVVQYAPEDHIGYHYLAPLLLQLDDTAGYKNFRAKILQQFGNTSDPRVAERMVKASLIIPASAEEMPVIARMSVVAAQHADTNNDAWSFNLFAKGLSEYRQGNYANATELLQKIIPLDPGSSCRAETFLVLAMAQARLNQSAASRESFVKAKDVVDHSLRKAGHLEDDWNEWIIIHMLLREAVASMPDMAASSVSSETPAWQSALAKTGFKFKFEQQGDGTWEIDFDDQPISDLSPLRGAPISRLTLMHTAVSDLSPLRGMSLKWLRLAGTKVNDLSALAGMPIESLQISGAPVEDLSPLRGMPLKMLNMTRCMAITNLEPISQIKTFESVILPPNAKDFEFLRSCPNLTRLGFKYDSATKGPEFSAAEFWANFDKTKAAQNTSQR